MSTRKKKTTPESSHPVNSSFEWCQQRDECIKALHARRKEVDALIQQLKLDGHICLWILEEPVRVLWCEQKECTHKAK